MLREFNVRDFLAGTARAPHGAMISSSEADEIQAEFARMTAERDAARDAANENRLDAIRMQRERDALRERAGQAVVWAEDDAPFTGPEVRELLRENAALRERAGQAERDRLSEELDRAWDGHRSDREMLLKRIDELAAERDAARAECDRLEQLVADFRAASMLDVGNQGGPCRVEPRHVEAHVVALRGRAERAERERDAVAKAWPEFGGKCVYGTLDRGWCAQTGRYTEESGFADKATAVRFLAGLDAAPAEKGGV